MSAACDNDGLLVATVAASRLWNQLSLEIRSAETQFSFRKKLKTYLAQTTNANGFSELYVRLRLCLSRL